MIIRSLPLIRRGELLRYWAPALAWSAVLLALSGNLGASTGSGELLQYLVTLILGQVSDTTFAILHFLFRKTAHLVAYGLLGALDFRAVRGPRHGWTLRRSTIASGLALFIAILDEWHQTMVPNRTGSVEDVVVDAIGVVVAQMIYRRMGN